MKIYVVLLSLCLSLSCTTKKVSVNNVENNGTNTSVSDPTKNGRIVLEVIPQTYSVVPDKIDLTITNNSSSDLQYGAGYQIEKFNKSTQKWEHINFFDGIAVIAIMYFLPVSESKTYPISLYPDQVKYESGTYRVKKQIYTGEESRDFYAEFVIK